MQTMHVSVAFTNTYWQNICITGQKKKKSVSPKDIKDNELPETME